MTAKPAPDLVPAIGILLKDLRIWVRCRPSWQDSATRDHSRCLIAAIRVLREAQEDTRSEGVACGLSLAADAVKRAYDAGGGENSASYYDGLLAAIDAIDEAQK